MKKRTIKWGSSRIKVYFDEKAVDQYEKDYKEKHKCNTYVHGFCDKQENKIWIREKLPIDLQRKCLWHELNHLCYDFLTNLSDESLAEINSRFVDEVLDRNKWVRQLYEKE